MYKQRITTCLCSSPELHSALQSLLANLFCFLLCNCNALVQLYRCDELFPANKALINGLPSHKEQTKSAGSWLT